MYAIEQGELPEEFVLAWRCACKHIQTMGQEGIQWLRATLNPPIAEHLSFRLGNQLFFIFVDVESVLPFAGKRKQLFLNVSKDAKATACVLKMKRSRDSFEPARFAWGLVDAVTGQDINPTEMVSRELIEISDWELHDFAIQVVRSHLEKERNKVFLWQSSLHIDPSIWFEDGSERRWVVVRADRYPKRRAKRPENLEDIKQWCARIGRTGFFASVTAANADDCFTPLYRGHGMHVLFEGLELV